MHCTDDLQSFTLSELAPYFDYPINEAADKLGVCSTVLKKVCRNNGVLRWPHRKIKSINGMIDSLQELIDASEGDAIPSLNMDMNELLEKKKYLLENPNTSYKAVVTKYAINAFNTKIQKAQTRSESEKSLLFHLLVAHQSYIFPDQAKEFKNIKPAKSLPSPPLTKLK